jgi:DNA-binding winged helix-turn-helix (wHTH) protein/TolB-like protein/tetratricopeptide (TPR) repeat protein
MCPQRELRFGAFELHVATGDLTRQGRRVALQDQPARVLTLLAQRTGQLVTREELRRTLWAEDTYVDFETGLNVAIKKVRQALGDSATAPRFIETVPKRGYRFLADVRVIEEELPIGSTGGVDTAAAHGSVVLGARVPSLVWWGLAASVVLVVMSVMAMRFGSVADRRDGTPPRSIAVLPFTPLVARADDAWLQRGLTDAVINKLSRLSQLRVEPLARVLPYAAAGQDPVAAGKTLGVDAVLEGSFQRTDKGLHVRARLLRTRDGTALASHEWQQPFIDILDVQSRLAESVTSSLAVHLTEDERAAIRKPETRVPEALTHYHFGRYHLEIREARHIVDAEREFREAIRLDPNYAPAYAGLSHALTATAWFGRSTGREVLDEARAAATRALELDDSLAFAHLMRAVLYDTFEYEPRNAQREFLRAIQLDPDEPWVLRQFGNFLANRGAVDEALELSRHDLELTPALPLANRFKAQWLYVARRYDECIDQVRRTLTLEPRYATAYYWLSLCLEQQGRRDEMIEALERQDTLVGLEQIAEPLRRLYVARGWEAYWRARLDRALKARATTSELTMLYLRLGDLDQAFLTLERAYDQRDPWILNINRPQFDLLRKHPAFPGMRTRIGVSDDISAELKVARAAWRAGLDQTRR